MRDVRGMRVKNEKRAKAALITATAVLTAALMLCLALLAATSAKAHVMQNTFAGRLDKDVVEQGGQVTYTATYTGSTTSIDVPRFLALRCVDEQGNIALEVTTDIDLNMYVADGTHNRDITFDAPNEPGAYTVYLVDSGNPSAKYGEVVGKLTVVEAPPPPPAPAADHGTDPYFTRHYDFWVPQLAQLEALGNSGTLTVDTAGQDIDHIMACVFGKLENTGRTLVVKHQGSTYTIRGGPDVEGRMNGILLGHNHSFAILGGYR